MSSALESRVDLKRRGHEYCDHAHDDLGDLCGQDTGFHIFSNPDTVRGPDGASIIWVIDPERRTAQVYRADGSVALIGNNGALDGEDVLPGWQCSLEELLR